MNKTSMLVLMAALAAFAMTPGAARAQVDEEAANKAREKGDNKLATKTRGDNAARKLEKSPDQLTFDSFSKAMQWELKTDKETTEKIKEIIKRFRPKDEPSDATEDEEAGDAEAVALRAIKDAAIQANEDGDQKRFKELMQEIPQKRSGTREEAESMNPEMLYAIDALLQEPLRNDFWQIMARFTNKEKINPGGRFLDLMEGIELSEEQGAAISKHYLNYLKAMREVQPGDAEALKEVRKGFQQALTAELSKAQRVAFQQALMTAERGGKKGREAHVRW